MKNRLWSVMQQEIVNSLRRRSYLIMTFAVPLLVIVGVGALVWFQKTRPEGDDPAQSNLPEQPLGYVDYSGLFEEPGSFANMFIPYASETAARADVAAGKIAGYYVIPEEYLATGQVAVCGSNQRDGKRFRLV